jgi:hypothetical protein
MTDEPAAAEHDEQVQALRAALARGAAAASSAAAGLWLLAVATVLLGTQLASRAKDTGEARDLGEAVVVDTSGLLLAAELFALVALLVALVLWTRWVREAAAVLPLVEERETPSATRPRRALSVLWRAGGEAPRPRALDVVALLGPVAVVVVALLTLVPRGYDSAQALDLAAMLACVLLLGVVLLAIGVLRRISDRHVGRAKYVTGER